MARTKEQLTDQLMAELQELPADKMSTVLDFVGYLKSQRRARRLERGSAQAILSVLEEVGPLQFASGELDSLLSDLERLRELDMPAHG